MTKRKQLHFRSTMVKPPRSYTCWRINQKIISADGRRVREARTNAKHHLTLCFTLSTQLQNNSMTLHYHSSLSLDTAFSHKETPWMHQGSLPDFADTPPKLNGLSENDPPECVEEQCLRDLPPTVQLSAIIWEAYTHPHEALHLNTHPHNLEQCRHRPLQALLPPSPSCSSLC